jgi:hypothetical protein
MEQTVRSIFHYKHRSQLSGVLPILAIGVALLKEFRVRLSP